MGMKFVNTKVIDELFLLFFVNYFLIICISNIDIFYIIFSSLINEINLFSNNHFNNLFLTKSNSDIVVIEPQLKHIIEKVQPQLNLSTSEKRSIKNYYYLIDQIANKKREISGYEKTIINPNSANFDLNNAIVKTKFERKLDSNVSYYLFSRYTQSDALSPRDIYNVITANINANPSGGISKTGNLSEEDSRFITEIFGEKKLKVMDNYLKNYMGVTPDLLEFLKKGELFDEKSLKHFNSKKLEIILTFMDMLEPKYNSEQLYKTLIEELPKNMRNDSIRNIPSNSIITSTGNFTYTTPDYRNDFNIEIYKDLDNCKKVIKDNLTDDLNSFLNVHKTLIKTFEESQLPLEPHSLHQLFKNVPIHKLESLSPEELRSCYESCKTIQPKFREIPIAEHVYAPWTEERELRIEEFLANNDPKKFIKQYSDPMDRILDLYNPICYKDLTQQELDFIKEYNLKKTNLDNIDYLPFFFAVPMKKKTKKKKLKFNSFECFKKNIFKLKFVKYFYNDDLGETQSITKNLDLIEKTTK